MTENEAIERIRSGICNERGTQRFCRDSCMYGIDKCAYSMAIQALFEIQQYRAIGTVEELQRQKEYIDTINEVCSGYSAIGTIDEFKALKNAEGKTVYLINNNTDSCCGCEGLVVGDDYCDKCQIAYPQCSEMPVCEKQYLEVVELKASAKWIFDNTENFGRTVFLTREEAEQALKQICEEET